MAIGKAERSVMAAPEKDGFERIPSLEVSPSALPLSMARRIYLTEQLKITRP